MTLWLVQPHDSLIARDGRPFNGADGARAQTLPFPPTSMVAGATRGRIGTNAEGVFAHPNPEELLQHAVSGPFLAELDSAGQLSEWWFPAPADAVVLADEDDRATVHQLVPLPQYVGLTNLPAGLTPVGLPTSIPAKPRSTAYWRWRGAYQQWLTAPSVHPLDGSTVLSHLPLDTRTHVAIDPDQRAVGDESGKLYMTTGLKFQTSMRRQFALAVDVAQSMGDAPPLFTMGGERRVVHWKQSAGALPTLPPEVARFIAATKQCRVVLLTPALYTDGWQPTFLCAPRDGVTPRLVAAAGGKPQVHSGWELRTAKSNGGPKPSRRYAPAGSVYWLELDGSDTAIEQWVRTLWLTAISDDAQARLDGAGIVVIGIA